MESNTEGLYRVCAFVLQSGYGESIEQPRQSAGNASVITGLFIGEQKSRARISFPGCRKAVFGIQQDGIRVWRQDFAHVFLEFGERLRGYAFRRQPGRFRKKFAKGVSLIDRERADHPALIAQGLHSTLFSRCDPEEPSRTDAVVMRLSKPDDFRFSAFAFPFKNSEASARALNHRHIDAGFAKHFQIALRDSSVGNRFVHRRYRHD